MRGRANIKALLGMALTLAQGISPGRYRLRFYRFGVPLRRHFLRHHALQIFLHRHPVNHIQTILEWHQTQCTTIGFIVVRADELGQIALILYRKFQNSCIGLLEFLAVKFPAST